MSRVHEALFRAVSEAQAPEADAGVRSSRNEEGNLKPELRRRPGATRKRGFVTAHDDTAINGNSRSSDFPRSLRAEVVKLVQRVFVFPNSHAPRSVVFSSVEGSGSSQVCFRVAEVLAESSASVCLISTCAPVPKEQIEAPSKCRGWAGAITSADPIADFVLPTTLENLWVIPSGVQENGRLHVSSELRSRIGEVKEEFDYVLIDAPAIVSSPDAVVLGQVTDGLILVVEANYTRRETARLAKETLDAAKVTVLGAILNNHTLPGA